MTASRYFYDDVDIWDVPSQSNPSVARVSPNGTRFAFVKKVFLRTKQGVLFCRPRGPTKQKIESLESYWLVERVILCFVFVFVIGKGQPKLG